MKSFLVIFFISLNLFCEEFSINLEGSMERSILGEPIYIKIEIENVSGKEKRVSNILIDYVLKDSNGEVIKRRPESIMENFYEPCEKSKIDYISANWKDKKVINLLELYKIKQAGEYELEVLVSPRCRRGIDREGNLDLNLWYGKLKKNIKIKVEEPQGEDREAYEYFKGEVPLSGERSKEVLEKFPTSTYAGWVLAPFFYNKAPIANGKQIVKNALLDEGKRDVKISKKEKDKDGQYIFLSSEEAAERYINKAEQFAKAKPSDKNIGAIYAGISLCYMYLRDWQKAYNYAKKSLELEWPQWIYSSYFPNLEKQRQVLEEAIEEILRLGLAKKQ